MKKGERACTCVHVLPSTTNTTRTTVTDCALACYTFREERKGLRGENERAALTESRDEEARTIRSLIAQLCETFYNNGWATGTGGGCSIRVGGPSESRAWRVFVAPSGIQKEDMIGDDVFELDMDRVSTAIFSSPKRMLSVGVNNLSS